MSAYPHFPVRPAHLLDGIWDFGWAGDDVDLDAIDPGAIAWVDRMPVPGCFDAAPRWLGWRGTAAYRRLVMLTPGCAGLIRFGGCGLRTRVYVDGKLLHANELPYTGFDVAVPPSEHRRRELVVVVDNRFDDVDLAIMRQWYDYYCYGGIYRPVTWYEVPATRFDRVRISVKDLASGTIRADVHLAGDVPATIDLSVAIDHHDRHEVKGVPVVDAVATIELDVPEPSPWSPETPTLHHLSLHTADDDIVERFGLRTVESRGTEILLNGQPVVLKGFCRHESHPTFGPALPPVQMVQDLQLLKDLGCNFIRGSHYPQDQRFLDLCDELGFIVFEESLGWGHDQTQWSTNKFAADNLAQTKAMVANSFNHPAVIMWGFLNEGGSHLPEHRRLYEDLVGTIRALDGSRLVTYASNRIFENTGDRHFDLIDVVSLNLYPGWYSRDRDTVAPLDEIVPCLRKWMADADAAKGAGKPLILSEIGAGAIYGWRDRLRAHWSEEYQADYLEVVCREVLENPRIAGVALWQFCDGRTYATAQALGRPRAFNNKGVVDEWRRPKLGYEVVKRAFRERRGGSRRGRFPHGDRRAGQLLEPLDDNG